MIKPGDIIDSSQLYCYLYNGFGGKEQLENRLAENELVLVLASVSTKTYDSNNPELYVLSSTGKMGWTFESGMKAK